MNDGNIGKTNAAGMIINVFKINQNKVHRQTISEMIISKNQGIHERNPPQLAALDGCCFIHKRKK